MDSQLDGNFLPGSLPHKFILIVTLIICFVVNNFFLSLPGHRVAAPTIWNYLQTRSVHLIRLIHPGDT